MTWALVNLNSVPAICARCESQDAPYLYVVIYPDGGVGAERYCQTHRDQCKEALRRGERMAQVLTLPQYRIQPRTKEMR